MSENTLVTFTCGECGRGGFTVVDRNPPIPMEVVAIYDKDNEGEDCGECPRCGTQFPEFHLHHPEYLHRWAHPWIALDESETPHTTHELAQIILAADDKRLQPGEVFGPTRRGLTDGQGMEDGEQAEHLDRDDADALDDKRMNP